jgi:hypothetical protein
MALGQVSSCALEIGLGEYPVSVFSANSFVFWADDPYSSAEPHVSGMKR